MYVRAQSPPPPPPTAATVSAPTSSASSRTASSQPSSRSSPSPPPRAPKSSPAAGRPRRSTSSTPTFPSPPPPSPPQSLGSSPPTPAAPRGSTSSSPAAPPLPTSTPGSAPSPPSTSRNSSSGPRPTSPCASRHHPSPAAPSAPLSSPTAASPRRRRSLLPPPRQALPPPLLAPSAAALHGLLAGCPELASLSLDRVFGCRTLRVRSGSLRSLTVSVSLTRRRVLEHLVVEDAPALDRLLARDINWGPSINVVHAPRLQMLGYLGVGIPELQLGSALFRSMCTVRLAVDFRCVRTLALELADPQLKPVADFLGASPAWRYVTSHMVVPQSMKILNYEMADPI